MKCQFCLVEIGGWHFHVSCKHPSFKFPMALQIKNAPCVKCNRDAIANKNQRLDSVVCVECSDDKRWQDGVCYVYEGCSCDLTKLMNLGCRCGALVRERIT